MKHFILFYLFFLAVTLRASPVKLGIDMLQEENFATLEGKEIGLVAHPASVDSRQVSTITILRKAKNFHLTALFGPEHGIYADEYAGAKISNRKDAITGLPIYSLYGDTRKPTPEMLRGLDALVFDLQDIGSRSYTYISSMKLCLEACREAAIEFIVLDRPNPIGGNRIEGPMVEKGFESFVSALPVPYLHGMTMGELALLMRDKICPDYKKLKVIKMSGWKRSMLWDDTGLTWIPTSPHIPYASTCAAYAATGILGELGQISNGVGYTQPFDLIGAPWIQARSLATALNDFWSTSTDTYRIVSDNGDIRSLPPKTPEGIRFLPVRYKPFYALFKDKPCQGVQIVLNPRTAETLVEINFRVLETLNAPKLIASASREQRSMFDKCCGTDAPRKALSAGGIGLSKLYEQWKSSCEQFREARKKFLLYE